MINLSQKHDTGQPADTIPTKKAVDFATHIGRFIVAGYGCAILGAIAGAILGALAALPFFPPGGSLFGFALGGIGGLAAGFIGGILRGPHGFRIGGIVGAVLSISVFPWSIFLLLPPALAMAVGCVFGDYLDREVNKEKPAFFLARIMRRLTCGMDSYARWVRITFVIANVVPLVVVALILAWNYIVNPK